MNQAITAVVRAKANAKLRTVAATMPAEPVGQFDVLVIDPPWPMEKIEPEVRPHQGMMNYPTMSEEELRTWDIPSRFAASDCHVFLWTTHRFLPLALTRLDAWGFR